MHQIQQAVFNRHASANTKYHALYGFFFLGLSKLQLAKIYGKSTVTVGNWIKQYQDSGLVTRKERKKVYLQFNDEKRHWIIMLFRTEPTLFLDEAKHRFENTFQCPISTSSISRILHAEGYTWKVIERRAIQVKEAQICHFVNELCSFNWNLQNLVFFG